MTEPDKSAPEVTSSTSYEKRDLDVNKVITVVVISAIILAVVLVMLYQLFVLTAEKQIYQAQLKPVSVPLRELRAQETEILTSYKLLDSAGGTYQIPIDRAMKVLAEEAYQDRMKEPKVK